MPSVVSWLQPTCFLQSRPKETMFKAWVPNIQGAPGGTMTARHSTGSHWYGLGCSEDEFKHVVLSAKAPIGFSRVRARERALLALCSTHI
jgi:hypothetical protein